MSYKPILLKLFSKDKYLILTHNLLLIILTIKTTKNLFAYNLIVKYNKNFILLIGKNAIY